MSSSKSAIQRGIKRMFDFLIGLLGLAVAVFPMVFIALSIKISSRGPIFFKQKRPGKDKKVFVLYKFRSMTEEQNASGKLLADQKRLTGIGRLLRRFSLDELPELWNVIKGDMSLVGPRPLLVLYLDRYTESQARRHDVKPGITGWAQINGRNATTWEERFKLDVWYIDNWSLWLDIKIIFVTIIKVLTGEGISHPGFATMEEFKGTGNGKRD